LRSSNSSFKILQTILQIGKVRIKLQTSLASFQSFFSSLESLQRGSETEVTLGPVSLQLNTAGSVVVGESILHSVEVGSTTVGEVDVVGVVQGDGTGVELGGLVVLTVGEDLVALLLEVEGFGLALFVGFSRFGQFSDL